jgi:hypothetical protein
MKGVVAKAFTLFDQKGPEMDKACLVTVLSESLYVPNIALQDYITWEAIDDTHAKAVITAFGLSAGGIFTFNEAGEALEFTTDDRMAVGFDGSKQSIPGPLSTKVMNGMKRAFSGRRFCKRSGITPKATSFILTAKLNR